MRYVIYTLFFFIFIFEYIIEKLGIGFKLLSAFPEIVSLYIGLYIVLLFAISKRSKLQLRYLIFFGAFALHITIGIIGNHVQPLAVLAGLRYYLRFLPFFLLPLVYYQEDTEIRSQAIMLLLLGIIQLPIAVYQKLFEYSNILTGDYIAGTLAVAPILTLYLISMIAVLVGFFVKKRITAKTFTILLIIAFFPTAINETKATVILLPLALIIPMLFGVDKNKRFKVIGTVIPIFILLIFGFNYAYQMFFAKGGRSDAFTFFSSDKVEKYLYKGAEAGRVFGDSETEVGRIDAIILAYKENSNDFFRMVWGVGVGNAALSFSKKFQGKYNAEYMRLGGKQNSISHFMWEIGLLGILHIIWVLLLIFFDALNLRKSDDFIGSLALGWLGVTAIFLISLPYQNILTKNALIYPYSYFSGYLASLAFNKRKALNDINSHL